MNNRPSYLSREGLEAARRELEEMTNVRRAEVAARIHDAKEHGDLTENAEYEDAKNEQAFVEGRIQQLEALIKNATIIDDNHSTDHVQIGSTVAVESGDGAESFTIVGSAEARPTEGRISNESPVGRALLGKRKGEKVVVRVPAGDFTYKIVKIIVARGAPMDWADELAASVSGPQVVNDFEDAVRHRPRRQPARARRPRCDLARPARPRDAGDVPLWRRRSRRDGRGLAADARRGRAIHGRAARRCARAAGLGRAELRAPLRGDALPADVRAARDRGPSSTG